MKHYSEQEIEIKKNQFEKTIFRIHKVNNKYKIVNRELMRWHQTHNNKKDTLVNIDDILIKNGLEPNGKDEHNRVEYRYTVSIYYQSVLKINQTKYNSKTKRGLIDDWIVSNNVTNYFDSNLKLIKPNEICQKCFREYVWLPENLTSKIKNFLFDSDYRHIFKSFIIRGSNEFYFLIDSNQFGNLNATITLINENEGIYSFLTGYDFKYNIIDNNNTEFVLIKKPKNENTTHNNV